MAEGWIKVDEELPDHNKTRRLMKLLDIDNDKAVGLVVKLWLFTFRVAIATGDLEPWGDDGIAEGVRWKGDPHKLVEALRTCGKALEDGSRGPGFLEGYIVHDFSSRMRSVVYDRERQKNRREGKPAAAARPAQEAQPGCGIRVFDTRSIRVCRACFDQLPPCRQAGAGRRRRTGRRGSCRASTHRSTGRNT